LSETLISARLIGILFILRDRGNVCK